MDTIIASIADITSKMGSINTGIAGILSALVAIALLMLIFSRIGK